VIGDRLIFGQLAEVGRCIEEGILRQWRDAEVAAIFGIGFAPGTGGPLALMDRIGLSNVVAKLDDMAGKHGERFAPSPALRRMAERGERFFPSV
jgi:3-hydroxyacyl-CoA dehydrogenase/enoyl-CoA hydratase/3-hydroxybutyryl-CoA epimerase